MYGFITIPTPLIYDLISHPYFQRLRRISQMGLSYLVYPGAHHTRFHHALGCVHLMQMAVRSLRFKGVAINDEEAEALYVAILLHDIGHGPFSHALESNILEDISHENISLLFMQRLNTAFKGQLQLAIDIFSGKYPRPFFKQLISSQLDIDRLDYLKRDSFYTGVTEGNVNNQRLIAMLNVKDDLLVVEEKGIYSVEKFLLSRRLMYWQVYLHKTSLGAEVLLVNILKRAKWLSMQHRLTQVHNKLDYFVKEPKALSSKPEKALDYYAQLDDNDVVSALKKWIEHEDKVLSRLCEMLINRKLLHIKMHQEVIGPKKLQKKISVCCEQWSLNEEEAAYFVPTGSIYNKAYDQDMPIFILKKNGKLKEIAAFSDHSVLKTLAQPVIKHFIGFPKF
ncbi:MAG: HD domain-containing protein [Flavobacteriaceae bacterium]|nr:HD domain-containing protein [Flavobacteriaceae bacterium]